MAITLQANPTTLTWKNFNPTPTRITDPADGTLVDAYTTFGYNIPNLPLRRINGQLALADPMVVTITPNARVWTGITQTVALLSHEQFHYDVGIVTGRALARHMMRLRAGDIPSLRNLLQNTVRLHFQTRAGLLQKRYDIDTRHGTNARYQRIWKNRMVNCLANPRSDQLGGFYL